MYKRFIISAFLQAKMRFKSLWMKQEKQSENSINYCVMSRSTHSPIRSSRCRFWWLRTSFWWKSSTSWSEEWTSIRRHTRGATSKKCVRSLPMASSSRPFSRSCRSPSQSPSWWFGSARTWKASSTRRSYSPRSRLPQTFTLCWSFSCYWSRIGLSSMSSRSYSIWARHERKRC